MTLAAIRPGEWEWPLLLHVLGAMALVGGLVTVVTALALTLRADPADEGVLTRFAFYSLLLAVLPSYVVMRVAAQWLLGREFPEGTPEPDWVGVGLLVSDLGFVVVLLAGILLGLRRALPVATALFAVVLAADVVAVWAMTAKPG